MLSTYEKDLLAFAQQLVQIQSYSGQEEAAIRCVEEKMKALGYDEVRLDAMGNVVGRIGRGPKSILFDAHVDTVAVNDAEEWAIPPFSGQIADGHLHGRGSVDMKSAVAASVYAGALAKQRGLLEGKSVYVSATVFEEDCDGENLRHLFQELSLRPDYVVICEPSSNRIMLGHKGKAQCVVKTQGVSAHGAAPEKGVNAIYEMAEIIQRAERAQAALPEKDGLRATLTLSQISSTSASLNAVPSACEIYLDRRIIPGETEAAIKAEMDQLIADKRASWEIGTLHRQSWTGLPIRYEPFHLAWKIEESHELAQMLIAAYQRTFGAPPAEFGFWDFSTNAVTPVRLGIPTIGFGPGDYQLAHARNERIPLRQIVEACRFYIEVIGGV